MRLAIAPTPRHRGAPLRRLSLVPAALLAVFAAHACGNEDTGTGNEPVTEPTGPAPTTTPSVTSPGNTTVAPTGPTPSNTSPQPSTVGPTATGPTAVGPSGPTAGPTPSNTAPEPTGPTATAPGPEPTGTAPTDPGPEPTGTGPTTPEPGPDPGPVEGAYVPCSGEAFPAVTLTPVLEDLDSPIHMVTDPNNSAIMYVAERTGALRRFDTSAGGAGTELLSVTTSTSAECGFFAIALHPNFDGTAEKRIYVSYMPTCPASIFGEGGSSALDEYEVNGDTATFTRNLFEVAQPQGNHNGGNIAFGPDGYLYYGLGDGGGGNDTMDHGPNGNGQNTNVPLGKILRFDVDNLDTPPAGNLTAEQAGGSVDSRIYHYGLRNPWRFSFDRETDDLYIGDVGQDTREEISVAKAGAGNQNFGWSAREGTVACGMCGGHTLVGLPATEPIHDYATAAGGAGFFQGSVTGGFVYRGRKIPGMIGRYLYGDYVRGDIFALTYDGDSVCDEVAEPIPSADIPGESLVSFAQDADGELYVISMARGSISRIDPQ